MACGPKWRQTTLPCKCVVTTINASVTDWIPKCEVHTADLDRAAQNLADSIDATIEEMLFNDAIKTDDM